MSLAAELLARVERLEERAARIGHRFQVPEEWQPLEPQPPEVPPLPVQEERVDEGLEPEARRVKVPRDPAETLGPDVVRVAAAMRKRPWMVARIFRRRARQLAFSGEGELLRAARFDPLAAGLFAYRIQNGSRVG